MNDPSMRAYRLVETKKVLGIFPPQGRTIYEDSLSSIPAGSNSGSVPDENESMRIALGWISKLGISTNDLAHVAGSGRLRVYHSPSTVSRFDSASKSLVKEVRHRSLGFVRRVNGVDFTGIGASGGVWIEVGRGGTISNMDVIWPALEPQTTNAVADSATIMAYLRQGKARFPDLQDPKLASQLASASNITILDVVPYYHGGDGEEPEQTVSPFASIRISFAAGGETKELALMCPILKEE
ncbi:MAG: hypothetical protein HC841_08765 [Verrucomicrobiae bacterium]|nr:hypothetical protein [Verrucomicrobiae bacterium]